VNKPQQFFDIFQRKPGSRFAPSRMREITNPSVFHNFHNRNSFDISIFHLYDFCWKFVPSRFFSLARPKKRLSRILPIVTIGCVLARG